MKLHYDCRTDTYHDGLGNLLKTGEQVKQERLDRYNLELQRKLVKELIDELAVALVNRGVY